MFRDAPPSKRDYVSPSSVPLVYTTHLSRKTVVVNLIE